MNKEDLIQNIKEECDSRKANGENPSRIKNLRGLLHFDKNYSPKEQVEFSKDFLLSLLIKLKEKRSDLFTTAQLYDNETRQAWSDDLFPYSIIFKHIIPIGAQHIDESLLVQYIEYYDDKHEIVIFDDRYQKHFTSDLSSSLFYYAYVLDLIGLYLRSRELSNNIKDKLLDFKKCSALQKWEGQIKQVDSLIKGEYHIYDHPPVNKIKLSAKAISSGKKWRWFQERDFKFIDDKSRFFELLEELSQVNYFNNHLANKILERYEGSIDKKEYEVFILDLYNETNAEGNKRSGWFVGEKVVAFQIAIWLMHYLETDNQYSLLTKLVEKCFTKIPRVGPTSRKLGDHILRILYESASIEGLGVLINLESRSKYPVFREALDNAIKKAVHYSKLDPNQVEDLFINDFNISNGAIKMPFGDHASKIQIERFDKVDLLWFKQDGKTQKSVPAKVKSDFTSELKLWKAKQKDIKKELSGQKKRFEGFWVRKKTWSWDKWEKYIHNHELIRYISRRLIWRFENEGDSINAMWFDNGFVDSKNNRVENLHAYSISLWHPTLSKTEEIQEWRSLILNNEIKQPFKQAYREIYLVTDAEIETSTYTNRFLNHVVRHHNLAALAKQRIWVYPSVYSVEYPYKDYAEYGIKATFELENDHDFATMGRIHFRNTRNNEAMTMEETPSIIFSETLRDADLFVAICSIGIEEEWNQNRYRQYWYDFSVSNLSETAKTRRDILENMLPKLEIGAQCELTDKFLKVQGKIRTYKIHLGSGNILMEPNDQNLCIVPDRSATAKRIFLPFDEDAVFSIILSKAFLLAKDDEIKDPVILNQIKER